jgi:hypothetical protein
LTIEYIHFQQAMPESASYDDPATKALVLMQSHFSRQPLPTDLVSDLTTVLGPAVKLLQVIYCWAVLFYLYLALFVC